MVSRLEEAEEKPLTEKEIKKRKRLAAFRSESHSANSKLCAVELEGKGRVLVDVPASAEQATPGSPEPTPSKKRATNRRKKKAGEGSIDKRPSAIVGGPDDSSEKPNWPDAEFPWRLRTEERIELAKAEEEERLRCIERFLDRDSDDEDDVETPSEQADEQVHWTSIYHPNPEKSFQVRMGRGKMVPLRVAGDDNGNPTLRRPFRTDPGDALAALLSKKRVRTLSYRQQKRQRGAEDDEDDDETVCICNGKDDGRELVQCDACQTWYHLDCIGIKNISELGREEDPWFCRRCVTRSRSPSLEPTELLAEPTFVPTDNEPSGHRSSDTPFFHPGVQDSPNWASRAAPRTPTRGGTYTFADSAHSWSSWPDSRHAPSTPHQPYSGHPRVYNISTPGHTDGHVPSYYDESPFDPTSTPSRGIKFNAPFTTPKNTSWPQRSNGLFQTPSRPSGRGSANRSNMGQFPVHSASLDDGSVSSSVPDRFGRVAGYDESPIRRNKSIDGPIMQRKLHSPPRPRTSVSSSTLLQESPVVRLGNPHVQRAPEHRVLREAGM